MKLVQAGAGVIVLILVCSLAASAATPTGSTFQISNAGPNGDVFGTGIAYNSKRNEYLAVWEADGLSTPNEMEIFGQRLSASGAEIGGDFRISNAGTDGDTTRFASNGDVAYDATSDRYLVVWNADSLPTQNEFEIFGQVLSGTGAEIGGDFRISQVGADGDPARSANFPAVAANPRRNEFLVTWHGNGLPDPNEFEVFGQLLSAQGAEIGGDFRISNAGADGDALRFADTSALDYNSGSDTYLVAWRSDGGPTDDDIDVFGQLLRGNGTELGADFRISSSGPEGMTDRPVDHPAVAADPATGNYLVSWDGDQLGSEDEFEVFGQLLSSSGLELGGDIRLSTTGPDGDVLRNASFPDTDFNTALGEYLVVWSSDAVGDREEEVWAQRVARSGREIGSDIRVSVTGADGDQDRDAFIASLAYSPASNRHIVIYNANDLPDPNLFEVFGRQIAGARARRCEGKAVTHLGTRAPNVLYGTPRRDVIAGLGGRDVLLGLGGNDLLCGGKGNDVLRGGPGRDALRGGPGRDRLRGGPGRDSQRQ